MGLCSLLQIEYEWSQLTHSKGKRGRGRERNRWGKRSCGRMEIGGRDCRVETAECRGCGEGVVGQAAAAATALIPGKGWSPSHSNHLPLPPPHALTHNSNSLFPMLNRKKNPYMSKDIYILTLY